MCKEVVISRTDERTGSETRTLCDNLYIHSVFTANFCLNNVTAVMMLVPPLMYRYVVFTVAVMILMTLVCSCVQFTSR